MKKKILGVTVALGIFAGGYLTGQTVKVDAGEKSASGKLQASTIGLVNAHQVRAGDRAGTIAISGVLFETHLKQVAGTGDTAAVTRANGEALVQFNMFQVAQNQRMIELLEEISRK